MSEFPPSKIVCEKLLFAVLPAAVATAAVFAVGLLLAWGLVGRVLRQDWRKAAPSLAVLALAAGLAVSPLLATWVQGKVAAAKQAEDTETVARFTETYHFEAPFPWVPDGKWWHWGWYAIGLALAVEFVARLPGVGVGVGHLLRGAAAGVIAAAVVNPDLLKSETRWWLPLAAAGIAGPWAVVDAVGRRNPGGSVSTAMAVVSLGAATVLIHDAAAGFTDVSTFLLTGLAVLTVFAWITRTDVGAAGAVAVVPVATLFFLHRDPEGDTKVPVAAYWLVGLAPLMLAAFLFPPATRFGQRYWATPVKVLAVTLPVAVAIYRCVTEAPLKFGEEQW